MLNKKETVSVFDIEGISVKLAQFDTGKAGTLLKTLAIEKAKGTAPQELAAAVRNLANTHKVSATRIIVSLPRHKVTIKNIKLPSIRPSEIESMVSLQAAKQLPFSPDKIVSSFKVLGRDSNGYSDVMMALAQHDVVASALEIFTRAELDIERLALSSEGLILRYGEDQKKDTGKGALLQIDIGKQTVEILITRQGRPELTRSINFPTPSDMAAKMLEEIKKSLFSYKKPDIARLILTGRRSLVKREAPELKALLNLPTVYIDALKSYPKAASATLPVEEDIQSESFTSILSIGLCKNSLSTNLIPPRMRRKRASMMVRESLVISGALLLSVILGVTGITTKAYIDKRRFLASINRELMNTKPKVDRLTKLKRVTSVIKKQSNFSGSSVDVIRELYGKIPSTMSLNILGYEDGRSCLLRGTAQALSDVFKFISVMEESIYFENVKVRYATKRMVGTKELTDFEIICQLAQVDMEKI